MKLQKEGAAITDVVACFPEKPPKKTLFFAAHTHRGQRGWARIVHGEIHKANKRQLARRAGSQRAAWSLRLLSGGRIVDPYFPTV